MKALPTAEQVREILDYNPLAGTFTWKLRSGDDSLTKRFNSRFAGREAGSPDKLGYRQIQIDGRTYFAHRLAWLVTHGVWPAGLIDHVNGVVDDNRIANLRECTNAENQQNRRLARNNTSGTTGVSWHPGKKRWQAMIRHQGAAIHLGMFDDLASARQAFEAAKRKYHTFNSSARVA